MSGGVSHLDLCERGFGCAWDAWENIVYRWGMGGQEDDGMIDEKTAAPH